MRLPRLQCQGKTNPPHGESRQAVQTSHTANHLPQPGHLDEATPPGVETLLCGLVPLLQSRLAV